jgi:hypothetical protein
MLPIPMPHSLFWMGTFGGRQAGAERGIDLVFDDLVVIPKAKGTISVMWVSGPYTLIGTPKDLLRLAHQSIPCS